MTADDRPLERDVDLVLAGVHLRLGSLALARAELEGLAGRDALDADGLVDLAEARWRTGDVAGAGEAATMALDGEEGPLVALLIAAEAAAARGRPTEARRLAARALADAGEGTGIDRLFAGMPRAAVWPADPAAPPPAPATLFPTSTPAIGARSIRPSGSPAATGTSGRPADPAGLLASTFGSREVVGPGASAGAMSGGPGLWDETGGISAATDDGGELPSPDLELGLGTAALQAGDAQEAALHLSVALRLVPAFAPAVLDLVIDRDEPALALVRGDAYRLVGREIEARRAFADAARSGPRMTSLSRASDVGSPPRDAGPGDDPAPADDQAAGPTTGAEPPPEGDPA